MDPHTLIEILDGIMQLAKIIGREETGSKLLESLLKKMNAIKDEEHQNHPKVLAIEWIEPFFTAGHWIPEMVKLAGGTNVISKGGEHSKRLSFDEIKKANPDIIIVMPCGFNIKRSVSEYMNSLKNNQQWNTLRAVKNNLVYAVDANSFFSKPSIRTITGLEVFAKIIHPEKFSELPVPENSFQIIK